MAKYWRHIFDVSALWYDVPGIILILEDTEVLDSGAEACLEDDCGGLSVGL